MVRETEIALAGGAVCLLLDPHFGDGPKPLYVGKSVLFQDSYWRVRKVAQRNGFVVRVVLERTDPFTP